MNATTATTATIHHPSCPRRGLPASAECILAGRHLLLITDHDVDHCAARHACLCGPEAAAEDQVILMERAPDTMLLDILAHADAAQGNYLGLKEGPVGRRLRALRLRGMGL